MLSRRLNISDSELVALGRSNSIHSLIEWRCTKTSELSATGIDEVLDRGGGLSGGGSRHDLGNELARLAYFLQSCVSHFPNVLNMLLNDSISHPPFC